MISDETREASWETEGTYYSVAGVGSFLLCGVFFVKSLLIQYFKDTSISFVNIRSFNKSKLELK